MTNTDNAHHMESGHFDTVAASWDDNPRRQEMTLAIADGIRAAIPLHKDWHVLEYGCGTANLSYLLAPHVGTVVAADSSPGMITQVQKKITGHPLVKVSPRLLDLEHQPVPTEGFELIVMAMALHHIIDVPKLLGQLTGMLNPGGWLALADLCREDGSFHHPRQVPHNGFVVNEVEANLQEIKGYSKCSSRIVHQLQKNGRGYPIFLLTAQHP